MNRSLGLAAAIAVGGVTIAVAIVSDRGGEARVGIASLRAAEADAEVLRGEPLHRTSGDLSVYVPAELAARRGRFDVVVHFHGIPKNQEENAEESHLRAVFVSANEGVVSGAYAKAFTGAGALDRLLAFAERAIDESGRFAGGRAGRVALSAWSAGGAAVTHILSRDADRVDAVIVADGLFSSYEDAAGKSINAAPLEPFVAFARRAEAGEKLFILTHTAIDTTGYPSVRECADELLRELDLPKHAPPGDAPEAGGAPTYAADRGDLHVVGYDGKGAHDHIAQIRALDSAYAALARRWHD